MKANEIEVIDVPQEELEALVDEALRKPLSEEGHRTLRALIDTYCYLTRELEQKRVSLQRLKRLLFGPKGEKTRDVLPGEDSEGEEKALGSGEEEGEGAAGGEEKPGDNKGKKKRKGHGRNGADKYVGAEVIEIPHESLKPGDDCPKTNCEGKVYRQAKPARLVRIVGQAPLRGKVYELERLRCNLCLTVFTAKAPEGVGEKKYDETAVSMMVILRYGSGLPLNRLEKLQESLGIPLPASTQWDVAHQASPIFIPAYEELIRQAAQGEVVHNDDTGMTILELMMEDQKRRNSGDPPDRTGLFTSGIVSVRDEIRIALFFTGRKHAGENLSKVLAERAAELGPPIQMSDALSRNVSGDFETIVCSCMCHARRLYVDVVENFPEECGLVLKTLGKVFKNDATARNEGMSPEERLEFHRKESFRPMAELRLWMCKQLRDRQVEPNSGLGQAISYMRKHWKELTRFLFIPGAPLENNLVERALKRAIIHRKNSLFYKTENGARVGDLYMSLIATSQLAGVNHFDYLTELQRNAAQVADDPSKWMPWNYRDTLASLETRGVERN
jgi:transposase